MKNSEWIKEHLNTIFDEDRPIEEKLEAVREKIKIFNGKLYKYYSFNDEYALSNLQNNIIHFSKPEKFNDPFDCSIAISLDSIIEILLPALLDKKLTLSDEDSQIKKVIMQLLVNKGEKAQTKEEKFVDIIIGLPSVKEIIKNGTGIDNDETKVKITQDLINSGHLPELISMLLDNNIKFDINNLDKLGSIKSLFSNEALAEHNKSLSEDQKLKLKLICDLAKEDKIINKINKLKPYLGEENAQIDKELEDSNAMLNSVKSNIDLKLNQTFAISCFSEKSDEILMWSHYANKHTGFCVEYNFFKSNDWDVSIRLFPVIYSGDRGQIPSSLFDISDINNIQISTNKQAISDLMLLLLYKSKIWEYEAEWRIIGEQKLLTDGHLKELPIVSKVFLGANISEENKSKIIEIIKSKENVEVYQYTIDDNQYKLNLNKL